jgi:hypothetical protein
VPLKPLSINLLSKVLKLDADNTSMDKKTFKVGDKVRYSILGDIERVWEVTSTFPVSGDIVLCLSRPDETTKLKVDRCNAGASECLHES